MNLIEQLGGYEYLNGFYKRAVAHGFTLTEIKEELLKYRRQHNIFERNDYVVNKDIRYSDELNIVSASNDKALWFFGKIYGGFVKSQFRHATDAEIEAGKRLEVKSEN